MTTGDTSGGLVLPAPFDTVEAHAYVEHSCRKLSWHVREPGTIHRNRYSDAENTVLERAHGAAPPPGCLHTAASMTACGSPSATTPADNSKPKCCPSSRATASTAGRPEHRKEGEMMQLEDDQRHRHSNPDNRHYSTSTRSVGPLAPTATDGVAGGEDGAGGISTRSRSTVGA